MGAYDTSLQIDGLKEKSETLSTKVTDLNKDRGLKINDILLTIDPDPGDEFILCNGENVDLENDFLNYSKYKVYIDDENESLSGGATGIAYDGNDTIALITYDNDVNAIYIRGISVSTGKKTVTLIRSTSYSADNLVFYKGYWVVTAIISDSLFVFTSTAPNVAWSVAYSGTYYGNGVHMKIVNDTLVIISPHRSKSSNNSGTNYLFYTNDIASGFTRVSTNIKSTYTHKSNLGIEYCHGLYYISVVSTSSSTISYGNSIYYSTSLSGPWTEISITEFDYELCDMLAITQDGVDKLACLVNRSSSKYDIILIDPSDQSVQNTILDINVSDYVPYALCKYGNGYIIIPNNSSKSGTKILYSDEITGPYEEISNSKYYSYESIMQCGYTGNGYSIVCTTSKTNTRQMFFAEKRCLPSVSISDGYAFLKIKESEVT